jgi:hypothetical protein
VLLQNQVAGSVSAPVNRAATLFAPFAEEHGKCSSDLVGCFCLIEYDRHGPISECPLPATESLVQEYTDLPEGSAGRKLLESRYGKANLQRLIRKIEEEKANQVWIESSTQECPYCSIHVEKSMGCNHVRICFLPYDDLTPLMLTW